MALGIERQVAEQAFANLDSGSTVSSRLWPAVADRIREARKEQGLTDVQVAERAGMTVDSYYDLEARNDEAFTVPSLAEIARVGQVLNRSLRALLFGESVSENQEITFAEIPSRLRDRLTASGLGIDEFCGEIGWEVNEVLSRPEALWNFNIVGLRDVCRAVGVDWPVALPDQDSSPPAPLQPLAS